MTAHLHTVAEIRANPAFFAEDLQQPGVSAAQGLMLAAEGAVLFPADPNAMANFNNWINVAYQLNSFNDPAAQAFTQSVINATLGPSDLAGLTIVTNAASGGTLGRVTGGAYVVNNIGPDAGNYQWTGTFIANDHSTDPRLQNVALNATLNQFGAAEGWGLDVAATQQPGGTGSLVGIEDGVSKDIGTPGAALGEDIVIGPATPGATGFADIGLRIGPLDAGNAIIGTAVQITGAAANYQHGAIQVPTGTPALFDAYGDGIEFQNGHVLILVGGHQVADFHA